MAYPTMAVANAFIQRALDDKLPNLSPMKLQKLLFFVQSWHLKWYKEPLIDDVFFRWQYGPVIPSLYHEFKHYGSKAIDRFGTFVSPRGAIEAIVPKEDQRTWQVIDEVIRAYGALTGSQLSSITHYEGSAWQVTGGADGGPILNDELVKGRIG
jgi:uncharacterized phage-associated protein